MKNKTYLNIIGVFFASMLLFAACQKDEPVKLQPNVATLQILNLTDSSADVSGLIIAEGDGFTKLGVCWNTEAAPTIDNQTASVKKGNSSVYTASLSGLNYTTKYYVRAFATNAAGTTVYSQDTSFTTPVRLAIVTLDEVTEIASYSATSGGNVTELGGGTVTAKGVCWGTEPDPTVKSSKTEDGNGLGAFTSNITGLRGYTQYYYRAYATNEAGTAYSKSIVAGFERKLTFKTLTSAPYVTTVSAAAQATTATAKGEVTYDGGTAVTQRGICYSTSANPTTADSKVTSAGTTGAFEVNISSLVTNTTYHYRAYATNSKGTSYGDDKTFATYPPALFMIGDGVGSWDWAVADLPMIPVHSHPNLFWKIVWMESTGFFKMAPQKAWSGDFGKTGSINGEIWDKGGENIPVPGTAGYYMVVVDLATNKIEVTAPKVYGIGNAFGGYWTANDSRYLFTVDNVNQVIKFVGVPGSGTPPVTPNDLRAHVAASTLVCDWWQAEVNIVGTTIVFRATGGDPASFPVATGSTISFNFKAGTAAVTP